MRNLAKSPPTYKKIANTPRVPVETRNITTRTVDRASEHTLPVHTMYSAASSYADGFKDFPSPVRRLEDSHDTNLPHIDPMASSIRFHTSVCKIE